MKVLFLSAHAFLPSSRKATVHFISESLAARGHRVSMISVGFSLLSRIVKPHLFEQLYARQRNRFEELGPNYRAACYLPPLHPFSSRYRLLNWVNRPLFKIYGARLPDFMRREIEAADAVIIESGTGICFFEAVGAANPQAKLFYLNCDRLDTVGASPYLIETEQRFAAAADMVFVPSPKLKDHMPAETRVKFVPQGIEKRLFDVCETSPYPQGSSNLISVGNMLFDAGAVAEIARHNPGLTLHLFGAEIAGDFPGNVKLYGEKPFADIVPYIKFADIALAPYRLREKEVYLAQSSLKLQQFSYCLLPTLVPDLLAGTRANLVAYRQAGEDDWQGVVRRALALERQADWRNGILTWDEVAAEIEAEFRI